MVSVTQTLSASKVDRPCREPHSAVYTRLFEQKNIRPRAHQAIREQDVTRQKEVPQPTQQAQFALALAGITGEPQSQHGAAGEREYGSDARQWKAEAGMLRVGLGISRLIFRRVGHRDDRPIKHVNSMPLPSPLRPNLVLQRAPHLASHFREKCLGQTLLGLTVRTCLL